MQLPGYPGGLQRRHDKGKPDASPGRKATGPSRAAELPNVDRPTLRDRRPRSAAEPATVPPRTENRGSDGNHRSSSALPDRGRRRPAPERLPPGRGGVGKGSARSRAPMHSPTDAPHSPRPLHGQADVTSTVGSPWGRDGSRDPSSLDGFGQGRRGLESGRVGTRTRSARRSGSRAVVGMACSGVELKESCDVGRLGTLPSHPHLGPAVSVARNARGSDVI